MIILAVGAVIIAVGAVYYSGDLETAAPEVPATATSPSPDASPPEGTPAATPDAQPAPGVPGQQN
jgi:hypothetical protein